MSKKQRKLNRLMDLLALTSVLVSTVWLIEVCL